MDPMVGPSGFCGFFSDRPPRCLRILQVGPGLTGVGIDSDSQGGYNGARMKKFVCMMVLLCLALVVQAAPMKVASLHPLLSDMAQRIGGDAVKVVDLFPVNGSLHAFEPSTRELSMAVGAKLLLAMGKNVEPYLADLRENLPAATKFVVLGEQIPDVMLPGTQTPDPHWWNSPANMKRASRTLLAELSGADPAHAADFARRQRAYAAEMDELMQLGRMLLGRVPQERRVLVTEHAAMCHFCEAFRLTPLAIQGVAAESQGDTASLAKLMADLRARKVTCLFSEYNGSPRHVQVIAAQLGAAFMPLVMDGIAPDMQGYKKMMTYNIGVVAGGLGKTPMKKAEMPAQADADVARLLYEIQERAVQQAEKELREEAEGKHVHGPGCQH